MVNGDDSLHAGISDSITKFNCVVNIKSMQKDELFKVWVGLVMIWWKPKLNVKKSILEPSKLVLSLVYQDFVFTLKSPRATIMKGFFQPCDQNLILGFP